MTTRDYQRRYRQKHRESYNAYQRKYFKGYRKQQVSLKRAAIIEAKARPCLDCGLSYPYYVMDFDHVRGEKKFTISSPGDRTLTSVLAEIAKCDVVCSNCHRIRTFTRKSLDTL